MFHDIFILTDDDFISLVDYYNEALKQSHLDISHLLSIINVMMCKINNEHVYEYALNNISPGHDSKNLYIKIIQNINKNNINYTLNTLVFACKTCNDILIIECMNHKVIPNKICLSHSLRLMINNFFDYCLSYVEPDIDILCEACKYSGIEDIQKILDAKITPNTQCFINTIKSNMTLTRIKGILKTLCEHSGVINKTILKYMIKHKIPLELAFKQGLTNDDVFDVCHYNFSVRDDLKMIKFDTSQKQLYKMIDSRAKYNDIIEFKNKNMIEFDCYCYDLLLIFNCVGSHGREDDYDKFKKILNDAIINNIYIPTIEAINRCDNMFNRKNLLEKYNFI
jgi:hypothetical protein